MIVHNGFVAKFLDDGSTAMVEVDTAAPARPKPRPVTKKTNGATADNAGTAKVSAVIEITSDEEKSASHSYLLQPLLTFFRPPKKKQRSGSIDAGDDSSVSSEDAGA
jgi:hypothetical protein